VRVIYRYAEDHLFWVEHWFHTIWFDKIRAFGRLLVNNGILNEIDDIFMFNRYEIPEILTEVATGWALGVNIPLRSDYYKEKVDKEEKFFRQLANGFLRPPLVFPLKRWRNPLLLCCGVSLLTG